MRQWQRFTKACLKRLPEQKGGGLSPGACSPPIMRKSKAAIGCEGRTAPDALKDKVFRPGCFFVLSTVMAPSATISHKNAHKPDRGNMFHSLERLSARRSK